jgi:hypothetical protein
MSRWWPAIVTHRDATKAARMGGYAAVGLAAWLGVPTLVSIALGSAEKGLVSPIELLIVALLVGLALQGARRFATRRGARIGIVLIVVLVVEAIKRLAITVSFGVFDVVVAFMMVFGLLSGVRGARALTHLTPDEGLNDVVT